MWSSSPLMILTLVVASGIAFPRTRDEDSENSATNDVSFGTEGLEKIARALSSEGGDSEEELDERETTDESGEDEAPRVAASNDELQATSTKRGRKHKAFFLNYPFVPQIRRRQSSPSHETNFASHNDLVGEQKPGHRKRFQQESQIYYIRLPPTPYMFVPGLGYISQPPTFSAASLQRPPPVTHVQRPSRPQMVHRKPTAKPFINVPIDFVSNGKPTGVYQWTGSKRPESSLNSLNEGPYVFNGRPSSLYLLTPDGRKTGHQPIRLADYSGKGYY